MKRSPETFRYRGGIASHLIEQLIVQQSAFKLASLGKFYRIQKNKFLVSFTLQKLIKLHFQNGNVGK